MVILLYCYFVFLYLLTFGLEVRLVKRFLIQRLFYIHLVKSTDVIQLIDS